MPGLRKITYAEKRKAKGLGVYFKYAHLTYDTVVTPWGIYLIIVWTRFNLLGMTSVGS